MLTNIWNTVLYQPFLNALAFLVSVVPGGDVGLAVIILTVLVKILLFPLSQRSIESQAARWSELYALSNLPFSWSRIIAAASIGEHNFFFFIIPPFEVVLVIESVSHRALSKYLDSVRHKL